MACIDAPTLAREMKIWIITSSFPLNPQDARAAAGLFVKDFAVALAESGHEIAVITPDKHPGEKEDPPGVRVHWFAWRGGRKTLSTMRPYHPGDALAMLSLFREGRRALEIQYEQGAPDHVLAMWAVPAGYLAMGLPGTAPFTTWCLGSDIWVYGDWILRSVVRRVLKASDLIFADGLATGRRCGRLAGPVSLPGVESTAESRVDSAAELPGMKGRSFSSAATPVKGVDVLLEAMAEFAGREPSGTLHV
jgi:hypothetical protein